MIITPGQTKDISNLETSGGSPDLKRIKAELEEVQQGTNNYFRRAGCALDWVNSRWPGQTIDGRRWWKYDGQTDPFPWPGSADTRVRLSKMLVNEYRTLGMHALMNMKLQARSTRPSATAKEAQQATILLNWQIFTHMQEEWHRETELALVWSAIFGASVMSVDWEQERRLDHIPINVMQFGQWVSRQIRTPLNILQVQSLLEDPSYEKELVGFVQDLSDVLTKSKAKSILNDLRTLRTAEVPVPYTYRSKPRLMALRPMIDVFFSLGADDLQRERWVDRVEYVTQSVLTDRIETDNYDAGFVAEAVKRKGIYSTQYGYDSNFQETYGGYNVIRPGNRPDQTGVNAENGLIELHHFKYYKLDMGVPCLYRLVFHHDLDDYATHGIDEYLHGQMNMHSFRFETDQRPILSSQGIPEITYTWENELKAQFDGRTDLASLKLAPPMFTRHDQLDKIGEGFRPNALIPMLPGMEPHFAATPPYDPGPIEISRDIMQRAANYFGWFGVDVDPQLKQMRQMEVVDRVTTQFKPVVGQVGMLDDQFLPDDVWLRVTGIPPRKGIHDANEVRGGYEMTMTCDLRNLDTDFIKATNDALAQLLPMDNAGIVDRTVVVRNRMEAIDYNLADMAIRSPEAASNHEVTDEMEKVSLIMGSGIEQPMPPPGSNFGLRLQTLQNTLSQSPYTKMRLNQAPDVLKVIENRFLYLQRQIQQEKNAQIGRVQVGGAFDKGTAAQVAPMLSQ